MPRYSKKEFIELAFISHQTLSVNIKRKKVVPNANNEIDTALAINLDFLNKCIDRHKQKELKGKTENEPTNDSGSKKPKTVPTPKAPIPEAPKVKKRNLSKEDEDTEKQAVANYNLERYKKQLEIEALENSNKIAQIKLDKLNGVVIPTELVMVIFGQHSKSITTAFHQASEDFVMTMAKTYDVDKKAQADMRGNLIAIINKAVYDSLEISREQIDNIVDEYAINGK